MLNIDFFADVKEYLENVNGDSPQNEQKGAQNKKYISNYQKDIKPVKKGLEIALTISEDNKYLTHKGIRYKIPDFYNKELIKKRDEKTLEMVCISLGFYQNYAGMPVTFVFVE